MAKRTIEVKGTTINVDERDYISLSDICAGFEAGTALIQNWMRTRTTVEFLGVWERLFNPGFNSIEFDRIKNESGSNTFILSVKKWGDCTGAVGITSRAGRYGAGVFAHTDITAHFYAWLSPEFHLLLIREFQRLKTMESGDWQLNNGELPIRMLAAISATTPSIIELHVLANMESYNAILLRNGQNQWQRINELTRTAAEQMKLFEETNIAAIRRLKEAVNRLESPENDLPDQVKD